MPWVWGREPPVQSGAPPLLTSAAVAGEQEAAQQRQGSQPSAAHGRPHRARTPTAAKEPGSWSPAADVTDEGRGRSEGGTPDCPHPTHTRTRVGCTSAEKQADLSKSRASRRLSQVPDCRCGHIWPVSLEPASATRGARFAFFFFPDKEKEPRFHTWDREGEGASGVSTEPVQALGLGGVKAGNPPPKTLLVGNQQSQGHVPHIPGRPHFATSCPTEWTSHQN